MALFNHATKEVTAKLVYYGPGLCGKTTNLQWIHDNLSFKSKGKLVSLATQADRTLFFDFLPVELGTIRGMRTRMQIYTVPGQVFYEATRRMVLKGCDAVVFVADSQAAMLDANAESQRSLRQNLLVNEIDPSIPQVIQYNKRDTATALPISVLNERLNPRNLPYFEAVAFKGTGVEETLKGVTKLLFQWLSRYYGEGAGDAASASAGTAAPGAPAERVMIRVAHATLPTPETPSPRPAAAPAAAPVRPKPAAPAPAARPTAPAAPEAESEVAPTIRFAKPAQPAAPPRPPAVPPAAPPASPPVVRATPAPPPAPTQPPTRVAPPKPVVPPTPVTPPPAVAAPPPVATRVVQPAAPPARPSAPVVPEEEEVPSTIVFAKQPPQPQAPARPPEPEVPLFIEEDEEETASTIVFARSSQPAPPPTPPQPVAPVVAPAPPAEPAPAPRPEAVVARPQPVVLPGGGPKPATGAGLPPGMSAPAAVAKAEAKRPAPEGRPAAREPEKPSLPSDPPPKGEGLRSDQWLYLLDGAQRGPIDVEDLIDLVLTSIPENTKVWHPGLEGWVLASHVRQIADEIPPPIPIPGLARTGYGDEEMPDFNTVPPMLRSVLIADEDAAFRKYLAMPLAAQGFTIFEAADGSAAWQLAVQNRPWMILADISMPELDGFEFCRRVRSHPMLSRLPLLFISGSDKYKERYRALQIGADDFLSKNMPVRELLMRIQLLMTRYSDLSASEPKAGTADVAGAFQGRIEVFGAPALLQMCAQGRLTGLFTSLAEDADNTATVMGFREGDIIHATVGASSGTNAVYAFLAWSKGSFKFTPGDPGQGQPLAQSVEHLLLEGCRLLDEANKGGPENGTAFA
jgi:CheY-like chemotaxis protein/signal recognition particle receptor subunit beta